MLLPLAHPPFIANAHSGPPVSKNPGRGQGGMGLAVGPWALRGIIPALGGTPALRGYPGGIHPADAGWTGPASGDEMPGSGPEALNGTDGAAGTGNDVGTGAGTGRKRGTGRGKRTGRGTGNAKAAAGGRSVWQQAWSAWQEAGLEWQRPAGWEPADTDLQRTEPIPVVRASAALMETGLASPAAGPPGGRPPGLGHGGDGGSAQDGDSGGDGRRGEDGGHGEDKDSVGDAGDKDALADGDAVQDGGAVQDSGAVEGSGAAADGRAGGNGRAGENGRAGRDGQSGAHPPRRSRRTVLLAAASGVAVLVVAVAGVGITRTLSSGPVHGPNGLTVAHPSARLADAQFTTLPGQPGQGALPALTGVAAVGRTVVAVGSQATFPSTRPLILTSPDGGRTWQPAVLRVPGGGTAAGAGTVPAMVTGGYGAWLALAPGAAWTSRDGRTWLLGPGIAPLAEGDRVRALARTGSGFVAVGENVDLHSQEPVISPVLWTSSDGMAWQRRNASQLRLFARGGQVLALRWVAARGNVIVIGGDITRTVVKHRGKRKIAVVTGSTEVWRSTDHGGRRTAAVLSHGGGGPGQTAALGGQRRGGPHPGPGRGVDHGGGQPPGAGHGPCAAVLHGRR